MFAIIRSGGKQYRVAQNDTLLVEKLDAKEGDTVKFDDVLFAEGGKKVSVIGKVLAHLRDDKIMIVKKRRRKHYKRTIGHRQPHTKIEITEVKSA
ncbi:MAG: 50S ribosomal protein L21 [Alphaproteobacteria bacterium]|nr:50S ribosomal protein L21 [Alphaproteobacteria bacterium]